ncbi:MAG: phosphate-starvation-inducible PsiE family protein [Desulfuromonadaceae bacterium]|nr:phosphate-starvation-inducible PsiE family protein [Desulfuromonadaceae bacterium]MDD5104496.1 phosphate-starvation-inducible PsiE family protein [Desulfuromonadaceae bacterium]
MWKEDIIDLNISRFFEMSARVVLSLLIIVILMAIVAGVGCTFYDLRLVFQQSYHTAFKTIMVDMLTVLAIVEVLRTALAYFTEGRVKVTYIIDTVIVTILTEVMAFWYKEMEWQEVAMIISLVLSLAFIRIIAVRFSPRRFQEEL